MKLLADESVDRQIVERLRRDGHEVASVADLAPGLEDPAVLERANAQDAILLTADRDFGELVFRQSQVHAGVALIRLSGLSAERKGAIVASAIRQHEAELAGAFVVISPVSVRIRRRTK